MFFSECNTDLSNDRKSGIYDVWITPSLDFSGIIFCDLIDARNLLFKSVMIIFRYMHCKLHFQEIVIRISGHF